MHKDATLRLKKGIVFIVRRWAFFVAYLHQPPLISRCHHSTLITCFILEIDSRYKNSIVVLSRSLGFLILWLMPSSDYTTWCMKRVSGNDSTGKFKKDVRQKWAIRGVYVLMFWNTEKEKNVGERHTYLSVLYSPSGFPPLYIAFLHPVFCADSSRYQAC